MNASISTTKLFLDVELSLKLCPPSKNPQYTSLPSNIQKQVHWKGRKLINLNKVNYDIDKQPRVLKVVQDSASEIKISFQVNGFIHSEYPPVVVIDEKIEGNYKGLIGHTRNQALRSLGYTTMMYDLYDFDSPLAEALFNGVSNQVVNPKTAHSKVDVIMQVCRAIDDGLIDNTESSINNFINIVAADKSISQRKTIYKGVRDRKAQHAHLDTYHCGKGVASTEEAAKRFNIPYKGDSNYTSINKLGYIPPDPEPITSFNASKQLLKKYGYDKFIYFHGYIPDPMPIPELYNQRTRWEDSFNTYVEEQAEFIRNIVKKLGVDVSKSDICEVLPWKFVGFLPQDISPDSNKGGLPRETSIVDKNGNPINNL